MNRMIFVNLATDDLARANVFYAALGFSKNETFSDANATSWHISEQILVMVLQRDFFASFMAHGDVPALADNHREVLNALSVENKQDVDKFLADAVAGGGRIYRPAVEPFPGMYQAAAQDPDGHVWEVAWMSPEAMANPQ